MADFELSEHVVLVLNYVEFIRIGEHDFRFHDILQLVDNLECTTADPDGEHIHIQDLNLRNELLNRNVIVSCHVDGARCRDCYSQSDGYEEFARKVTHQMFTRDKTPGIKLSCSREEFEKNYQMLLDLLPHEN